MSLPVFLARWAVTVSIFTQFLKLGLTSFGGPAAHIGFFHQAFVVRQRWFDDSTFARWIALCHLLPGPSSSQLGFLIGYQRGGWPGAVAAFVGFTLPSAMMMLGLAYGWFWLDDTWQPVWHALVLVAAAIVIQVTWQMSRQFCQAWSLKLLALLTALGLMLWPSVWAPVVLLLGLGMIATLFKHRFGFLAAVATSHNSVDSGERTPAFESRSPSIKTGWSLIVLAIGLLGILPLLAWTDERIWSIGDGFYRAGALVFGGGHVVLPMLELEWVQTGRVTESQFLAGYSLAQALPGPLFTFASYLGGVMAGWLGAVVATLAIFLPGLLLIIGILPFYQAFTSSERLQAGLVAVQAGVVGFLLFALVVPILPHALVDWASGVLVAMNLVLLLKWQWPAVWLMPLNIALYWSWVSFVSG